MTKLAKLIDRLPQPILPPEFNEQDRLKILNIMDVAKQKARPYAGDFKAPWLISDYFSSLWNTTNRGREEFLNGKWKNDYRINWDVPLPNGNRLTDVKYRMLLDCIKRISFLHRSGYFSCKQISPGTWYHATINLISFTRWVVLHEEEFFPETYGFKLLDQQAINSFMMIYAQGGWSSALQIIERLLSKLYESVYRKKCPQHVLDAAYELPDSMIADISAWLLAGGFFFKYKGKMSLHRSALAALINEPVDAIRAPSIKNVPLFCLQFASERRNIALLESRVVRREKPNQKSQTVAELVNSTLSEGSIHGIMKDLTPLFESHHHIPEMIPEPSQISLKASAALALRLTKPAGHNLFIPVNVGLAYLNHAIRFVNVYGDSIIEYFIATIKAIRRKYKGEYTDKKTLSKINRICLDLGENNYLVQTGASVIPVAEALGINGFTKESHSEGINYDSLRKKPTLIEALRVFIGSCIICIALLKPSRENELTHLKRDCLRLNKDGYHIYFKLGKTNVSEAYIDELRPIPFITAKAIQLLQKLGQGFAAITKDNRKMANNLFYLPNQTGSSGLTAGKSLLNLHLDIYCDYVGLSPDHLGRRWYVRIHEMRKWFLLLLFWASRYSVLDALRWIAGHKDAQHIYAYIQREFPGEELPKIEAEYSIERLRAVEYIGRYDNESEPGLAELRNLSMKMRHLH